MYAYFLSGGFGKGLGPVPPPFVYATATDVANAWRPLLAIWPLRQLRLLPTVFAFATYCTLAGTRLKRRDGGAWDGVSGDQSVRKSGCRCDRWTVCSRCVYGSDVAAHQTARTATRSPPTCTGTDAPLQSQCTNCCLKTCSKRPKWTDINCQFVR